MDLFQLNEEGTWEREFEEHRERAWTEEQLRTCLLTLREFTEKEGLRYTIINAKPMTEEWVDMAVAKYKKDFNIA